MFKIDLVYLWCDGNDFSFQEKKQKLLESYRLNLPEDNAGDIRYVQNNELLYSLRSAHANLPWINHIFIVTDSQVPTWLNKHDKISIIDHREIIPKNLLPTFNAYVIETYIHKIPTLSEHFLYANDDMFFMQPLTPFDFFTKKGLPIVRLDKSSKTFSINSAQRQIDINKKTFYSTLLNAWILFCKRNHRLIPFDTFDHSVSGYTKQSWIDILNKYPEITNANAFPFRTYNEIHRLIFSYEMTYCMNSDRVYINKPTFFNRILCRFVNREIWVSCRKSMKKMLRDTKLCHPKIVCLNKVDNRNLFEKTFCTLFPDPAPWEIRST